VAVVQFVEALRYKLEGRGLYSHGVTGIFHCKKLSGNTMAPGSTKPLTEMSSRFILWGWQPCHIHVPTIQKS